MKPIVTASLAALAAASLAANGLLYLRYSTGRPLVTVGGQVISKKDYQDAVDYQTQGAILKKMVLEALVGQAAAQAGVTPTDADVDARIADIHRSRPQMLAAADQDAAKMAQMRQDLKTDLGLENLRVKGVSVSDNDVAAYYALHKKDFAVPAQVRVTLVAAENAVDEATAASLLRQNIGTDVIARQPRLHVVGLNGFSMNQITQGLTPAENQKISAVVLRMKTGEVQTIPVRQDFLIVRALKSSEAGVPSLTQVKPQVTRLVKLEKADKEVPVNVEIAKLYQAAKPQFGVAKYEAYFTDLSSVDVTKPQNAKKTAAAR